MSNLIIRERRFETTSILDIEGKLTLGEGTGEFRNTVRQLIEKQQKNIVINLENVSSIDSSGLGELVAAYVAVTKSGGKVNLLHLSKNRRIYELMFITKLLTIFDVYDDEQEAVESLKTASQTFGTVAA